jgi:hypothetical protein
MSKIHANARAAAGFNSPDEEDDAPRKLPAAAVINRAMVEMAKIERDRKELAEREREVKKEWTNEGGSKQALGFIRKLERMDPDDRQSLLGEIDAYAAFLKYW